MVKSDGGADFFDLADIDRLVHEPARLAVMAVLYVLESADFTFLMNQTGLTWGNLSAHLSKLEEGGYIRSREDFQGEAPQHHPAADPPGKEGLPDLRHKNETGLQRSANRIIDHIQLIQ